MAGEKNFENRLKKWLESEGIYPLGEPVDRMSAPPCGFMGNSKEPPGGNMAFALGIIASSFIIS